MSNTHTRREPGRLLRKDGANTDPLAALEALNLPISFITRRYTYKWVSSSYASAVGKRREQIVGGTVRGLWGTAFDTVYKPLLDRCFQGSQLRSKVWVNFPAHGPRYCEVIHSPFCPDKKSTGAIVICYDTTERKKIEERIGQSAQRFRDLSEASLEAIVFTESGIIVNANKALGQLFGCKDHEVRGKRVTDFVIPEEKVLTDKIILSQTEGKWETVGLRKDGSRFPIEINVRTFHTKGGSFRIAVIRDLTERKQMEQQLKAHHEQLERLVEERTDQLRKSEEKFRAIFENATEGIFQIAPDGRYVSINPAFAAIHGYATPEEFINQAADVERLCVEPEQWREYNTLLHKEGHLQNFELKIYRKDRTVTWISVNSRIVRDATGAVMYYEGTVQDINQRKQTEQALEAKSRSLEEANTALKVLLKHRDEDRKELEEKFVSNMKQLVLPYVAKLRNGKLEPVLQVAADFVEANLKQILSPFLNSLRSFNFTPRQLQVIALLREDKTTKEIAALLKVSKEAIDMQRFLIRKKLGLNKGKTNLRSYLVSLG